MSSLERKENNAKNLLFIFIFTAGPVFIYIASLGLYFHI